MGIGEAIGILRGTEELPACRIELQIGMAMDGMRIRRRGQVVGFFPPRSIDHPPVRRRVLVGPYSLLSQRANLEAKKEKLPKVVTGPGKKEKLFSRVRRASSALVRR